MKKIMLLSALLITLITISAKAWTPCPYGLNLNCGPWVEAQITKTITITDNPLCTATVTYERYKRQCIIPPNMITYEFFITSLSFINQPCLYNYLNEGGYYHADRYSEIMNKLANLESNEIANDFFTDPANQSAYACNPDCVAGQTILRIGYSFPYCYAVCEATENGFTYYMHTACSPNHCCAILNVYCWDTINEEIQLCSGTYVEVGTGSCESYVPDCTPEVGTHLETLTWELKTPTCVYHCNP
jgi:hypothetical protein